MPHERPITLSAGPLSCLFYAGDLRYLSVAGREVLRRIYVGVRDATWGTVAPTFRNLLVQQHESGFDIDYVADFHRAPIRFECSVTIVATSPSPNCATIAFKIDGIARESFSTSRTGLCILHPIRELAGRPCQIEHPGGRVSEAVFPDLIDPAAPFTDVAGIRCDLDGLSTRLTFECEIFETEDQRNWSDTSYKTYCRPLALPRPYTLTVGDTVRQSVGFSVALEETHERRADDQSSTQPPLRIGPVVGRMPKLGIVLDRIPSAAVLEQLRPLHLWHIRHNLRPNGPGWRERLEAIAALGWPIELAVQLKDPDEAAGLSSLPKAVRRIIVYQAGRPMPDAALAAAVRRALGDDSTPSVSVGGGTIGNFTELNRNRPPAGTLDLLAYGVTPQVHAFDDLSLIENLAAQADAVRTARAFAPGVPLAVGPITLHRRPDPFAAGNDGKPAEGPIDPRHATDLAAAWTVGSIKYLAAAGAESLTYFEAAGPHGLMSDDATAYPLLEVFSAVADFAGGEVLAVSDPSPLQFVALAIRKAGRTRLIVANVSAEPVTVPIEAMPSLDLPAYGLKVI